MGILVDDLIADKARGELKYGSHTIHFEYSPNSYSPELIAKLASVRNMSNDDPRVFDSLAACVCDLLLWWDLVEKDGSMVSLEYERVGKLPTAFLIALINNLTQEIRLGEPKRRKSNATSNDSSAAVGDSAASQTSISGRRSQAGTGRSRG